MKTIIKKLEFQKLLLLSAIIYLPTVSIALFSDIKILFWCSFLIALNLFLEIRTSKKSNLIKKLLKFILIPLGIIFYFQNFALEYSQTNLACFVAIIGSVKIFEIKSLRDETLLIFISFFMLFTNLLFNTNLTTSILIISGLLLNITGLHFINGKKYQIKKLILESIKSFITALPLTIVIFLLFPRLPTATWGIQSSIKSKTGFSDNFKPGDVSNLAKNTELAFRAEFANRLPSREKLYWRAIVFDKLSLSGRWYSFPKQGNEIINQKQIDKDNNDVYKYSIYLEPHYSSWIFALDYPFDSDENVVMFEDLSIQNTSLTCRGNCKRRFKNRNYKGDRIDQLKRFNFSSDTLLKLNDPKHEKYLELPINTNPKTKKLGEAILAKSKNIKERVITASNFFKKQNLIYTLNPPIMRDNSSDDFLFKYKAGFCEHFASSFALLLRASGVSTRIVGGYLGGDINFKDRVISVYQSDAHVWVEAYYDNQWNRIDPTLFSAPSRLVNGIEGSISDGELPYMLKRSNLGLFYKPFKSLSNLWNKANFLWDKFIISYTFETQNKLLSILGFSNKIIFRVIQIFLIIFIFVILSFFIVFLSDRKKIKLDKHSKEYLKIRNYLQKKGLNIKASTGPLELEKLIHQSNFDKMYKDQLLDKISKYKSIKYVN